MYLSDRRAVQGRSESGNRRFEVLVIIDRPGKMEAQRSGERPVGYKAHSILSLGPLRKIGNVIGLVIGRKL